MNLAESGIDDSVPNERLEESDRLPGEIDDDTLRKYFTLTKADLEQVDQCRGPTNKLGFAIQLCTLRWHGYFLPDTRGIPSSVVEMIGSQLALLPIAPDNYPQNEKTRFCLFPGITFATKGPYISIASKRDGTGKVGINTTNHAAFQFGKAWLSVCWSSHPSYGVKAELHSALLRP